ncbi:ABC transporter substrate-binding protein [Kovacikia minuta CCNUW1]|uniref:ABC transporter substrate-binding protein n=1 Tax=Kovacikia minuta TaxID=2931930 RepID=UPI001CCDB19F|nr:ABC transporter substrate-binding protein [Kovacikia minuta]UBF26480.1 ABC transporter substrate-binding protein [Kovacikia minuta CCNUW1]
MLKTFSHLLTLLLLAISLLLSGCQPSQSHAEGVIHLTLWQGVNPPPNRDVLQKLVERFNREHPTIQVESLYVGQGDQQMPKILAAIVGNAVPDMLWYAPMLTGQLVELEAIRPLDDWWQTLPIREQVDPVLLESMQLEGHIWSIPFGTNNVGIFYRPSLFKAAGITKPPTTWDELRQIARQLTRDTNGDGRPDQYGMLLPLGKGEWSVFTWLPFMWSGGGELVAEGGGRRAEGGSQVSSSIPHPPSLIPHLTNSGAIAALELWRNLIQDGSAILSGPERGYELDGFLAGKVAMQLTGPWTLGQLQGMGVDFAVMPIPVGVKQATAAGGENLFVLKTTPEREKAALVFAEYVLSESFQTQWAIGTGYLPVNLKSRQSAEYQEFKAKQPAVDVFLEQAKYGRARPIFPGYNRISENLGRAIEATLMNQSSPLDALETSQKRLDLIFNPQ